MATEIQSLLAFRLHLRNSLRTGVQFVVQGTVQLFNEGVRVLAVQEVRALVPAAVVLDIGAFFCEVEEKVGRPPEVLLTVCIITL